MKKDERYMTINEAFEAAKKRLAENESKNDSKDDSDGEIIASRDRKGQPDRTGER